MSKEIKFSSDARSAMVRGVDILADRNVGFCDAAKVDERNDAADRDVGCGVVREVDDVALAGHRYGICCAVHVHSSLCAGVLVEPAVIPRLDAEVEAHEPLSAVHVARVRLLEDGRVLSTEERDLDRIDEAGRGGKIPRLRIRQLRVDDHGQRALEGVDHRRVRLRDIRRRLEELVCQRLQLGRDNEERRLFELFGKK